jgi:hypothetical protein
VTGNTTSVVGVNVTTAVCVGVGVFVLVRVFVLVGVAVTVGVAVFVGVAVTVGVAVFVGVSVGVMPSIGPDEGDALATEIRRKVPPSKHKSITASHLIQAALSRFLHISYPPEAFLLIDGRKIE